mmetsp:Transcript_24473/g.53216  ORF Transcript_24473/g.53216 Transcript_24473/m.53216 type:complete len:414 (+) Transcript_24473:817-2058(+)
MASVGEPDDGVGVVLRAVSYQVRQLERKINAKLWGEGPPRVSLVFHLGLLEELGPLVFALAGVVGERDVDLLRFLVVFVVLNVVDGVLVGKRRNVSLHEPTPHEFLKIERPLHRFQLTILPGVGVHIGDLMLLLQVHGPDAVGPLVEVLHHLIHLLLGVLGVAPLREKWPREVLALGLAIEVECPRLQLRGGGRTEPADVLGALPGAPQGLQVLPLLAVGPVHARRVHPAWVATDHLHGAVEGGPALAEQDLAALRERVGQLAVELELWVRGHGGGDVPVWEGHIVHATAADDHQPGLWGGLQGREGEAPQEVGAEEQVRGESHFDAILGQGLLVGQGPRVADEAVKPRDGAVVAALLLCELPPAAADVLLQAHVRDEKVDSVVRGLLADLLLGFLASLAAPADQVHRGALGG